MVLKPKLGVVAVLALSAIAFTGVLAVPRTSSASAPVVGPSACSQKQFHAAADKLDRKLKCYRYVVKEGRSISTAPGTALRECLDEAEEDFEKDFDKALDAEDCESLVYSSDLETLVDDAVSCIVDCVLWGSPCDCFNQCSGS